MAHTHHIKRHFDLILWWDPGPGSRFWSCRGVDATRRRNMRSLASAAFLACVAHAAPSGFDLVVGLPLKNLDTLEAKFWAISTPGSGSYLEFLSRDDLATLIGPSERDIESAKAWHVQNGANPASISVSPLGDRVIASYAAGSDRAWGASARVPTTPPHFDFVVRRDASAARRSPKFRAQKVGTPSSRLGYSVSAQKKAYGIPEDLTATNDATVQMVWGPGTFGYSESELERLKRDDVPLLNLDKVKFDTENHGEPGGDNFGEGNLDTQMISSFGLNATVIVSNTNTSSSTEEGNGFGEAMLDFVTALANREDLPQILSLSLGSLSSYSCDLLCEEAEKQGVEKSKCESFLQDQRQVCMFLSTDQAARISAGFMALGARGVSVFGSSGDGGSHFSFSPFSGGEIADTLNNISCTFQMPVFPTGSPYVVSVGGTVWKGGIVPNPSDPVAWSGSGGGFAWQFNRSAFQDTVVGSYLNQTSGLPSTDSFNTMGRAYPDVSAVSVDGTSQSSPTVAGIFGLVTDARLNAGLKPLGFLGPRIYQIAEKFPGEAWQSVTEGNTKTSCDNGFPAAQGWDPVTGFGRPKWEGLLKHFGSDDTI